MSTDKKRVLIVDDSTDDIQIIIENIKDEFATVVATTGEKALELAAKDNKPDVILMDVMMPGMDGYETCRQLKANPDTRDIDVIFISAHDTTDEKLNGYDAGGSDYLIKPVQPVELLQKIRLSISNKENRKQSSEQTEMAVKTAMVAMTSAGEQGVVLEYLRHSASAKTLEELAKLTVDYVKKYDLENTLQLRTSDQVILYGTRNPVPPLEAELLTRLHDKDRIMEYNKRSIFNFGGASLLIKNMPDDSDKHGRLRDHLAILMEGTENKLNDLDRGSKLAQLVIDSTKAMQEIRQSQTEHKVEAQRIMDRTLQNLHDAFLPWGLTEEQEENLVSMVHHGVEESMKHYETGLELDNKMNDIFQRLAEISGN